MWYSDVGHVLPDCRPCVTGPWLLFNGKTTMWYGEVYHVLLAVDIFYWDVDHELPNPESYCTGPTTM